MQSESFAVIIPDRGDRQQLTMHCLKQIARMTLKPDKVIHVNYEPTGQGFDLVERIREGINKAGSTDLCFIIENDDYMPTDYFERFGDMSQHDFFGQQTSIYYNLINRTYTQLNHPGRSSLFTTGFRVSALNRFRWPENTPFLDIKLWEYAQDHRRKFVDTGAIGIKTGIGLCGGKGHRMIFGGKDPDLKWLQANVDSDSFDFYSNLKC